VRGTHARRRLEALHRLAEALAELRELGGPEEHRRHAADDHQLGETEAEETHRGHAAGARTGSARDDAGGQLRGLSAEERGRRGAHAGHGRGLGRGGPGRGPGAGPHGVRGADNEGSGGCGHS